ncbi:MAG: hypothetical protein J5449_09235 [Oscillospiraceae bacterium]|nr:hypothetical protein [Oscillospiraceae bacterium]
MTKKRRIAAAVLAALVVLVALSASVFMIEHADHDCAGEDCAICERLYACAQNLRSLAAAAIVVFAAVIFASVLRVCVDRGASSYAQRTPVSLKVKLSN